MPRSRDAPGGLGPGPGPPVPRRPFAHASSLGPRSPRPSVSPERPRRPWRSQPPRDPLSLAPRAPRHPLLRMCALSKSRSHSLLPQSPNPHALELPWPLGVPSRATKPRYPRSPAPTAPHSAPHPSMCAFSKSSSCPSPASVDRDSCRSQDSPLPKETAHIRPGHRGVGRSGGVARSPVLRGVSSALRWIVRGGW